MATKLSVQQHEELTLQKAQVKPPAQMAGQRGNYPRMKTSNGVHFLTSTSLAVIQSNVKYISLTL